jgi:hypothetical protein
MIASDLTHVRICINTLPPPRAGFDSGPAKTHTQEPADQSTQATYSLRSHHWPTGWVYTQATREDNTKTQNDIWEHQTPGYDSRMRKGGFG